MQTFSSLLYVWVFNSVVMKGKKNSTVAHSNPNRYSHSGDVLSREGVGGVADEQTCFPHSSEVGRKKDKFQHSRTNSPKTQKQ